MVKKQRIIPFVLVALGLSSCQSPTIASLNSSSSASISADNSASSFSSAVSSSQTSSGSLASTSPVSSAPNKVTSSVAFDGVDNLSLEQNIVYSSPVYGKNISARFTGKDVDKFHPAFIYDNQGRLSVSKTFSYDATYTWHSVDTYTAIGSTVVPDSFLDNIIFDNPVSPRAPTVKDAVSYTYTINWNANHTINTSGSTVVAGIAVDMSSQIDSIKRNDGTIITDWSLKPNNTAYASASGKSFTVLNAADSVRINILVPDPNNSSATVQIGPYFTVKALSSQLNDIKENVTAKPFSQNYTAELVRNSDQSVLVKTIHNPKYFLKEDIATGKKSGILEKGSAVSFSLENGAVSLASQKTYPLNENEAGVICPFDNAAENDLSDALKNSWASVASIAINVSSAFFSSDFSHALLGVSLSDYVTAENAGTFLGVSYDKATDIVTIAILAKTVTGSTTVFSDTGYSILLSARGTSSNKALEAFLANSQMPSFPSVPEELPALFGTIAAKKNFTVQSHSYWTEGETELAAGATLTGLINSTSLHVGDFVAYGDKDIYFAEDRAKKTYAGAVSQNNRLYEISGVPDYQKGGVLWNKSDVTAVGTSEDYDLWSNANVTLLYSLSAFTEENLAKLNVLSKKTY
jgi:hypothetical protein